MNLIKYEEACRAVSAARTVDEVKEFLAGAQAAKAYARQAKNKKLELDAIEIRTRAERRLGEMIIDLQEQGHCRTLSLQERNAGKEIIKLSDLGIDGGLSQVAQRMALVKQDVFEQEIVRWRDESEFNPGRLTSPLPHARNPSYVSGKERSDARSGREKIDPADRLARFRAPDGRRISYWRVGELKRLEGLFYRAAECAKALRERMPVANADPLALVEKIYREEELLALLKDCFESREVPSSDAGLQGPRIRSARQARTRECESCSATFVMKKYSKRAGRFCSRDCAFEFQKRGGKVGLKELKCVDEGQSPAR